MSLLVSELNLLNIVDSLVVTTEVVISVVIFYNRFYLTLLCEICRLKLSWTLPLCR